MEIAMDWVSSKEAGPGSLSLSVHHSIPPLNSPKINQGQSIFDRRRTDLTSLLIQAQLGASSDLKRKQLETRSSVLSMDDQYGLM